VLFTAFHFVSKMQIVTSAAPLGRKSGRQKIQDGGASVREELCNFFSGVYRVEVCPHIVHAWEELKFATELSASKELPWHGRGS